MDPVAQIIIDTCESKWDAEQFDCSGFAKAVAAPLGVTLTGQADNIYAEIQGGNWTSLADGPAAKAAADQGLFVLVALTGGMHVPPQNNGHVCVVVSDPNNDTDVPTAYWGSIAHIGAKNARLTAAWNAASLPLVEYASTVPVAVAKTPITVQVQGATVPDAAGYLLNGETFAWLRPIADALKADLSNFTGSAIQMDLNGNSQVLQLTMNADEGFVHLGDLRSLGLNVNFDQPNNLVTIG